MYVTIWVLVLPADTIPTGVDRIYLISCPSLLVAFAVCRVAAYLHWWLDIN